MLNEFTVDFRSAEQELDLMVPLSMSSEGVGAALFVLSYLSDSKAGLLAGLALVCLGAAALFLHLGHPLKFWRVVSRAPTAWISRGAVFTGGLILSGFVGFFLPQETFTGMAVQTFGLLCALSVMLYTGLLYSSIPSVPFWHTGLLPLAFLLHSITSAAMIFMGFLPFSRTGSEPFARETAATIALLLISLGATWLITNPSSRSPAVQESIRQLTEGPLKNPFLYGAILSGLITPLAFLTLAFWLGPATRLSSGILLFAGMLARLAGDMAFRSAVLRAGVYEPLI